MVSIREYNKWGDAPWENKYPRNNSIIRKGKKARYSSEIIAALALLGTTTTRQMSKLILGNLPHYEYKPVRDKEARELETNFNRRIEKKEKKTSGKRKLEGKYPGLLADGYVIKTDTIISKKNQPAQTYFLSLKGCFFALGFNFNKNETLKFLENAAKNHLYFAYLKHVVNKTSYAFVKEIFIQPIQDMIEKGRINLEEDLTFYFSNFTEAHANAFSKIIERVLTYLDPNQDYYEHRMSKNIETLKKCTFYDEKVTSDWKDLMIEFFYKKPEEQDFFEDYCDKGIEVNFLFRTMKAIHFGYFNGFGFGVPPRTKKIPFSKKWKEYKKFNPKYKSPRDFDKAKGITLRH